MSNGGNSHCPKCPNVQDGPAKATQVRVHSNRLAVRRWRSSITDSSTVVDCTEGEREPWGAWHAFLARAQRAGNTPPFCTQATRLGCWLRFLGGDLGSFE